MLQVLVAGEAIITEWQTSIAGRVLSSGILCPTAQWKLKDVSEELITSILWAEE
jgi:hypothetical protein